MDRIALFSNDTQVISVRAVKWVNEFFCQFQNWCNCRSFPSKITQYVPLLKKKCTFVIISYVSDDESVFFSENEQRDPYYYLNQRFYICQIWGWELIDHPYTMNGARSLAISRCEFVTEVLQYLDVNLWQKSCSIQMWIFLLIVNVVMSWFPFIYFLTRVKLNLSGPWSDWPQPT